jgi:hypothetical protein
MEFIQLEKPLSILPTHVCVGFGSSKRLLNILSISIPPFAVDLNLFVSSKRLVENSG